MRKLLSAGMSQLWRCKIFWISCIFLAGTDALAMWTRYMDRIRFGVDNAMDSGFLYYAMFIGICVAIVCTLLLGTDYSDGTIRNKLITGSKRRDVYLANLAVCSAAALMMCTAAVIPGLALGKLLLGGFRMGAARAVLSILCAYAMSLSFTAIFTLLAMMVTNRTASAVAAIVLSIVLLIGGAYIDNRLQAKPTVEGLVITAIDETGAVDPDLSTVEEWPNPLYLPDGPMRDAFDFLHDFTPGGQAIQLVSTTASRFGLMLLYDGVIIILTTALGLYLFRRKDLK